MFKKKWTTPQLIVLVRGKPEERILAACKKSEGGGSSNDQAGACYMENVAANCDICSGTIGT